MPFLNCQSTPNENQKNLCIMYIDYLSIGMKNEIRVTVSNIIGPIAKPDKIQIVPGLPKTRSGKIMRRILRQIANGEFTDFGDISTLLDPDVVEKIIEDVDSAS